MTNSETRHGPKEGCQQCQIEHEFAGPAGSILYWGMRRSVTLSVTLKRTLNRQTYVAIMERGLVTNAVYGLPAIGLQSLQSNDRCTNPFVHT